MRISGPNAEGRMRTVIRLRQDRRLRFAEFRIAAGSRADRRREQAQVRRLPERIADRLG
jgi:hypothetical protein